MIPEVVWWVTLVDATMIRYPPETYSEVLASQDSSERKIIEGTFAGLRFVRNRMGYEADHDDFIHPRPKGSGPDATRIVAWTWRPVPEPDISSLLPRAHQSQMTRYRAYPPPL